MQKYVYSFQSAVGIFWIRPERDKSWGLYIGGEAGIVNVAMMWRKPVDFFVLPRELSRIGTESSTYRL
jgi:hypothetical protein